MSDSTTTSAPKPKVIYLSARDERLGGRHCIIAQDELIELNDLRAAISRIKRASQLNRLETRAEKMTRAIKKKIRNKWEVEDGLWRPRLVEQPRGASSASRLYIETT